MIRSVPSVQFSTNSSGNAIGLEGPSGDVNAQQTASPTTGQTITANDYTGNLILTPAATIAACTVVFPSVAAVFGEFTIATSNEIAALTLTPNTGQTINGSPSPATLQAGGFVTFILSNTVWHRKG